MTEAFICWEDISTYLLKSKFDCSPDVIIGVHRGGLPIGVTLSHRFEKPLDSFHVSRYDRKSEIVRCHLDAKSHYNEVLLVDDISDSGESLITAIKYLHENYSIGTIKTLCYCIKKDTKFIPDFYNETFESNIWIVFPWENYLKIGDSNE
jgi:hypoxanthine phosphoribosyltransferase